MGKLVEFIGNNYAWFLTISIILLFALIGYIYDTKKNKSDLLKKTENEIDEESIENIIVPDNEKTLNETVNVSKNINPESKQVELTDNTVVENNDSLNN